MSALTRRRVLVLSWNYPTPAAPQRGLWVERMCTAAAPGADVTAIVPTPWVPPLMPVRVLSRFRTVPREETRGGVQIYYPRVAGSIEYWTQSLDARLAFGPVMKLAARLHREKPFDLIHAHFIYPEGVDASRIGRALGVPVMTSEHAWWLPWLKNQPRVGRQVDAALDGIQVVAPVSQFLREGVAKYSGDRVRLHVLPNVVDDEVFHPAPVERDPNQLLYVGLIRRFKRVDVLVRAFAEVRKQFPAMRLRILSAKAFHAYGRDRREIRELITSLGLEQAVSITEGSDPPAVADAMRRSNLVVVSSTRHETFCAVAAEALACGTPLAITKCGGPEEFVTPDDGVMVPADDPAALAAGIVKALNVRSSFDEAAISRRIIARYGRTAWRALAMSTYEDVIAAYKANGHASR